MRLRYNLLSTVLAADIDDNDLVMDLTAAFAEGGVNIPTFASPDTLDVSIGPPGAIPTEVITVTSYTSGDTTAIPITRATGDTDAVAHAAGSVIINAPTKADYINPGPKAYRYTSGGGPLAVTAGVAKLLDETILDFVDQSSAEIPWENANDGFRPTVPGLYEMFAWATLDSDALTTGDASILIGGTQGSNVTPNIPYGSGRDMDLVTHATAWLDAGQLVTAIVQSSQNVNIDYAEFFLFRIQPPS